jgi:uncharacterized SAM-binding protein YcdF (DUF218 family)
MAQKKTPASGGRWWKRLLMACGVLFLALLLVALLGLPWPVYTWLGRDAKPLKGVPDYIVMMGGGGIPSESGLMRCYQTALMAGQFPQAQVVVAMPLEPGEDDEHPSTVVRELMQRGVVIERIAQEGRGRHTREQAVRVRELTRRGDREPVLLLVTSPEHMRRSLLAFRKAGFRSVHGSPVYGQNLEADVSYPSATGGRKLVPNLGGSLMLRYRLWDNLIVEIKVLRELAALGYYKAKGWI